MREQSFKNHSRLVPMYHYAASVLLIIGIVFSMINLIKAGKNEYYTAALLLISFLLFTLLFWFVRAFALKAQDRAIRAEENFRYFILSGKPLDKRLRMGQIIALRFASDEELISLAERAVTEKLSSKLIKKAIKNWRPDYYRV